MAHRLLHRHAEALGQNVQSQSRRRLQLQGMAPLECLCPQHLCHIQTPCIKPLAQGPNVCCLPAVSWCSKSSPRPVCAVCRLSDCAAGLECPAAPQHAAASPSQASAAPAHSASPAAHQHSLLGGCIRPQSMQAIRTDHAPAGGLRDIIRAFAGPGHTCSCLCTCSTASSALTAAAAGAACCCTCASTAARQASTVAQPCCTCCKGKLYQAMFTCVWHARMQMQALPRGSTSSQIDHCTGSDLQEQQMLVEAVL